MLSSDQAAPGFWNKTVSLLCFSGFGFCLTLDPVANLFGGFGSFFTRFPFVFSSPNDCDERDF